MPNDNNDSIRYLMKEMDPSEEVLMERSMMEDEDLLIEVESMRQTLKRLDDDLPEVEPPAHVTENILKKASEHKPDTSSYIIPISMGKNGMGYIAAAAVVAVGLISGVFFYQEGSERTETGQSTQQKAASVSSQTPLEALDVQMLPVNSTDIDVEPWVDRNEILRFEDQFSEQGRAEYDSILNTSTEKLKPLNDQMQLNGGAPRLQLTGSDQ